MYLTLLYKFWRLIVYFGYKENFPQINYKHIRYLTYKFLNHLISYFIKAEFKVGNVSVTYLQKLK